MMGELPQTFIFQIGDIIEKQEQGMQYFAEVLLLLKVNPTYIDHHTVYRYHCLDIQTGAVITIGKSIIEAYYKKVA